MSRRIIHGFLIAGIVVSFPILFKHYLPTQTGPAVNEIVTPPPPSAPEVAPSPPPEAEPLVKTIENEPPRAPLPIKRYKEIPKKGRVAIAPRANLNIDTPGSFPPLEPVVPKGLENAVNFWTRIYAQYDKDQVVFHDQENLGIIYKVLDFSQISNDPNLSAIEKKSLRESHIKEELKQLEKTLDPEAADNLRTQTGQKDKFVAGVQASGLYLPEIENIFQGYGLPKDLTRLVFVESMFQVNAYSKVGAAGIWQFMASSARIFRLNVSPLVDERYDPILSTHAAARHLIRNFQDLGTWPLAINAYNTGSGRLQDAIQKLGTREIATIIKRYRNPSYGFASRNFYPSFLAARHVFNNYKHYFGNLPIQPPFQYDLATFRRPMTLPELAQVLDISTERLRELNPALSATLFSQNRYFPEGSTLRVPAGFGNRLATLESPEAEQVP
ncbi:MAG: lytic transglycosylase domain-containing protein [Deltaproteobacteria bacterium]|nr:lytic transglycosylase domain-containing protein [Deltaproteobacteria bacterium]